MGRGGDGGLRRARPPRRRELRRRRGRGGSRAHRLPRRARRARLRAPAQPPRTRPRCSRGSRRAAHLLARRRGDRRRQRVVPGRLLPGQAAAGDGHAALGHRPAPSRSRSPTWSPTCAPRPTSRLPRGREIQIGGPEVTTYGGMIEEMARALDRRPPLRLAVPVLTPSLSSLWIGLVTPVDAGVARPLIEGLATETVVRDAPGWSCSTSRRRRSARRCARRSPSASRRPRRRGRRRPARAPPRRCRFRGTRSAAR